jgi:hypothetical protein
MKHSQILLCGMPRSGTTWIGKIFDSHPATLYRHEPVSGGRLNEIPMFPDVNDVEVYRAVVEDFVAQLPGMRSAKATVKLPLLPKQYYSPVQFLLRKGMVYGAKIVPGFFGEVAVPDVVNYDTLPGLSVVWKSIESVGRLGLVARILAPANAILIVRHPCGHIASVLRGESAGRFESLCATDEDWEMFRLLEQLPQARKRGLDLLSFRKMTGIERLAWRWALFNEKAMSDLEGVSGAAVVRYEDFCTDPVGATKSAFAFCGLNWNKQTEQFIHASTSHEKGAYYSVFKDPAKSANKWSEELSPAQIAAIMNVAAQTLPGKLYTNEVSGTLLTG